jgi:hypothetical protein
MSIVMPAMHLSHFDPFNSSYNTTYFDSQEHYLQPAVAYSSPHQFPVDPRWFNSSFSGHASAAPHYFSSMTHSDIISPPSPTDLLSLSPSSTIAPIPPLSRSRNRQSSMSNANPNSATNSRIRSFTRPGTRYQRQHSATSSHVSTTNPNTTTSDSNNANTPSTTTANINTPSTNTTTSTTQRIARRSTVSSSSPSSSRLLASPNHPYSSYTQSPTLRHSPPLGLDSSRATKRRRTDDHDASHLQSFTTVPEPPQLLTTTQTPQHLALMHAHHGYPPAQTWAGPPSASADHLPHGVSPDPHSYSQWPVLPLPYYPTDPTSDPHLHDVSLPSSDVSQTQMLPYPSPTLVGPAFFNSALSPEHLETPHSSHFPVPKYESVSPRLVHGLLDEEEGETIEHGPTEFPPRPYQDNKSPWVPTKVPGKIYGSRLEQVRYPCFCIVSFDSVN